jgi:hypothetical protein
MDVQGGHRAHDVDASTESASVRCSRTRNQMVKASGDGGHARRLAVYGARSREDWEVRSKSVWDADVRGALVVLEGRGIAGRVDESGFEVA